MKFRANKKVLIVVAIISAVLILLISSYLILISPFVFLIQYVYPEEAAQLYVKLDEPNYVTKDYSLKLENVDSITVNSPSFSKGYQLGSEKYEEIKNLLSGKQVEFITEIQLYDDDYSLEIKGKDNAKYYFNETQNGNYEIIVLDFTENLDVTYTLDYPYYLVTSISKDEFEMIFNTENNSF